MTKREDEGLKSKEEEGMAQRLKELKVADNNTCVKLEYERTEMSTLCFTNQAPEVPT